MLGLMLINLLLSEVVVVTYVPLWSQQMCTLWSSDFRIIIAAIVCSSGIAVAVVFVATKVFNCFQKVLRSLCVSFCKPPLVIEFFLDIMHKDLILYLSSHSWGWRISLINLANEALQHRSKYRSKKSQIKQKAMWDTCNNRKRVWDT